MLAASVGYITRDFVQITNAEGAQAMTREDWQACGDPLAMLYFLHGRASGRKFRLFAAACARDEFVNGTVTVDECPPEMLPQYHDKIVAAEAFADGAPALAYGWPFHWAAQPVCDVITDEDVAHAALGFNADVGLWTTPPEQIVPVMIRRYRTHPAHYLRDIFGSVFHPAPARRAWRAPEVLSLARAAYEERLLPGGELDRARLAVLADALEEAGCGDGDLLTHLRSPGPHVRGCWAVDRVLGKV